MGFPIVRGDMNRDLPAGVRAQRHRLLADARRLVIVEALEEGPRQIPELARLLGVHPTTVRAHLERLLAAGVIGEEPGIPAGRGRPSKRYRLLHRLPGGGPEVQLIVGSLVSLLQDAYGPGTVVRVEEEGVRCGRGMVRSFRHPSFEQAVREVIDILSRLSFDPACPTQQRDSAVIDVHHCPFNVEARDPNGAVLCAFHEGLVRGMAEAAAGEEIAVRVQPFAAPRLCRVELSRDTRRPVA